MPVGDAESVFEEPVLRSLRRYVGEAALSTPVLITERISNRILAGCINLTDGSSVIAVNARLKFDPELMAHALIEELVHAQQQLDGVDFEEQRRRFPYEERPYEIQAKQLATEVLGYEPEPCDVQLLRDEPPDLLDNRPRP